MTPRAIGARENIKILTEEISASAPQYLECRSFLVTEAAADINHRPFHTHTSAEKLDCYTLMFPLYIVGQSRGISTKMKARVIAQIHHMETHFELRNASLVARILKSGVVKNPWKVYAMLGSYAFVACSSTEAYNDT